MRARLALSVQVVKHILVNTDSNNGSYYVTSANAVYYPLISDLVEENKAKLSNPVHSSFLQDVIQQKMKSLSATVRSFARAHTRGHV
jgi:hypothetical protein